MNLNKFFIITFQPKQKELFRNKRRFSIGGGQIAKYIGESNAKAVRKMAEKSQAETIKIKFRKMGVITLYAK